MSIDLFHSYGFVCGQVTVSTKVGNRVHVELTTPRLRIVLARRPVLGYGVSIASISALPEGLLALASIAAAPTTHVSQVGVNMDELYVASDEIQQSGSIDVSSTDVSAWYERPSRKRIDVAVVFDPATTVELEQLMIAPYYDFISVHKLSDDTQQWCSTITHIEEHTPRYDLEITRR